MNGHLFCLRGIEKANFHHSIPKLVYGRRYPASIREGAVLRDKSSLAQQQRLVSRISCPMNTSRCCVLSPKQNGPEMLQTRGAERAGLLGTATSVLWFFCLVIFCSTKRIAETKKHRLLGSETTAYIMGGTRQATALGFSAFHSIGISP